MLEVSINDPPSVARVKEALLSNLLVQQSNTPSSIDDDDGSYFRMSIDRRFSITGAGTVVTGTVTSG